MEHGPFMVALLIQNALVFHSFLCFFPIPSTSASIITGLGRRKPIVLSLKHRGFNQQKLYLLAFNWNSGAVSMAIYWEFQSSLQPLPENLAVVLNFPFNRECINHRCSDQFGFNHFEPVQCGWLTKSGTVPNDPKKWYWKPRGWLLWPHLTMLSDHHIPVGSSQLGYRRWPNVAMVHPHWRISQWQVRFLGFPSHVYSILFP